MEIIKEALAILEPIPAEKWIEESFTDGKGRCCAMGHYNRIVNGKPEDYGLRNCIESDKCLTLAKAVKDESADIEDVNDGDHPDYQQDNPKDRVITFLKDRLK